MKVSNSNNTSNKTNYNNVVKSLVRIFGPNLCILLIYTKNSMEHSSSNRNILENITCLFEPKIEVVNCL